MDGWVEGWEVGGSRVDGWTGGWRGGGVCGWKVGVGRGHVGGAYGVCGRRYVWVDMGEGEGVGRSNDETTQMRNEKGAMKNEK